LPLLAALPLTVSISLLTALAAIIYWTMPHPTREQV
jgi:hypothetical protein